MRILPLDSSHLREGTADVDFEQTGDLAVRYPDGTYMIQDRSKDIIISGGENISSLSIESTLTSHPDISEIACVARLSEKWSVPFPSLPPRLR